MPEPTLPTRFTSLHHAPRHAAPPTHPLTPQLLVRWKYQGPNDPDRTGAELLGPTRRVNFVTTTISVLNDGNQTDVVRR